MSQNKPNLDAHAAAYWKTFEFDFENRLLLTAYAEKIVECIQESPSKGRVDLLSLGIGHQIVASHLNDHLEINRYTIVEGSKAIIQAFQEKSKGDSIEVVHSFFEEFETEEQYDFIEMGFVLEHVEDPERIVNQYKRFLKKDGLLFASVPNAKSLHRRLGKLSGLLEDYYLLSPADRQLGHVRYYDLDRFKSMFLDAGYKIRKEYGLFLKPFTREQMEKLQLEECILRALMEVGYDYPEMGNGILLVLQK